MTPNFTFDFNPVTHIVADAIGQPGQRTFYLQASQGTETANLLLEKQQVAALAASVLQLLEELEERHPELDGASADDIEITLVEPLSPSFRVGQLGLGYDENQDLMVVVAQAMPSAEQIEEGIDEEDPSLPKARFYATRDQMRALSERALRAVAAGRPECPLCGQPIDPDSHFCPRTNGHAYPLLL